MGALLAVWWQEQLDWHARQLAVHALFLAAMDHR